MNIGFVGLGSMGLPMAKNLVEAGYEVFVKDTNPDVVEEVLTLGAQTGDYEKIGRNCQVIFTMLPNSKTISEVLFGNNGVLAGIQDNPNEVIVCDLSNVAANFSQDCYVKCKSNGVQFLDAPVLGEVSDAEEGTLTFVVGGDLEAFERVEPILKVLGSNINYLGSTGSGSITKLANQMIVNLNVAAIAEAFTLIAKFGADPLKVFEAIREGNAKSNVLETKSHKIFSRDFSAGEKIATSFKDIRNALETAHDYGVPLLMTPHLCEIQNAQMVEGAMEEDHSSYVRFYEHLADCMVVDNESE